MVPQIMSVKVEGNGSGRYIMEVEVTWKLYESGSYRWQQIIDGSESNEKL